MYIPEDFQFNEAQEQMAFIKQYNFGMLITHTSKGLEATHIPFMYDDKKECFQAHIARANKQLENYENQEVLIVFQGPHAYVSSSWYNHPNVPTWNYVAVHVYGQLQIVKDKTDIKKALIDLVNHHEKHEDQPLDIDKIDDIINKEMRGITFFEINSLRFEGVKKLSQNRHAQDYSNIISHLENKGQENLTDFMKKVIK